MAKARGGIGSRTPRGTRKIADAGDIERGIDLCRSVALISGSAAIVALLSLRRSQKPVLSRSSPFRPHHSFDQSRIQRHLYCRQAAKSMIGIATQKPLEPQAIKPQQPPLSLLTPITTDVDADTRMPLEVQLLLKSMRVFGHLSESVFLDLIKAVTRRELQKGDVSDEILPASCRYACLCHSHTSADGMPLGQQVLFDHTQEDNIMYIVQAGEVSLFGSDPSSGAEAPAEQTQLISTVGPGEHLSSLLGILDHLTGGSSKVRGLEARASKNGTVIIELPFKAFRKTVDKRPEVFSRLLQVFSRAFRRARQQRHTHTHRNAFCRHPTMRACGCKLDADISIRTLVGTILSVRVSVLMGYICAYAQHALHVVAVIIAVAIASDVAVVHHYRSLRYICNGCRLWQCTSSSA